MNFFSKPKKRSAPKVLFDHIPKCCGSSFTDLFRKAYGNDRVAPTFMGEQALVAKKLFKKYDVVIGHFGGVIVDEWPCDFFSCTLIRNPVDRALSTYFYFQTLPNLSIPQVEAVRGMSLGEFAQCRLPVVNGILNNPLSRHFAAAYGYSGDYKNVSAVWDAAAAGFHSFDYVGVCEEFEKSVKGVFRALSVRVPKVDYKNYKLNKNNERIETEEIDKSVIRALEERNEFDMRLYSSALKRINGDRDLKLSYRTDQQPLSPFATCVLKSVSVQNLESGTASIKTGENIDLRIRFELIKPTKSFWYSVQIRNIADEIVFGANSSDSSIGIDLPHGEHEISLSIENLLKHGHYCIAVTLEDGTEQSTFGSIPHWATPEPVAHFDVLGNTGSPFYGAFKLPIHSSSLE
jgi:hypothetical protein